MRNLTIKITLAISCVILSACRANVPQFQTTTPNLVSSQSVSVSQGTRIYSLDEMRNEIAIGLFQRLDVNRNTFLEANEYQERFPQTQDLDNNKTIEKDEFIKQKDIILGSRFSVAKIQSDFKPMFARADRNSDGFISFSEDRSINKDFDYNGDQKYSYDEFEDYISQVFVLVPYHIEKWVNAYFLDA